MSSWPRPSETRAGLYLARPLFHSASFFLFLLRTRSSALQSNQHKWFACQISSTSDEEVWFLLILFSSSTLRSISSHSQSSSGSHQPIWQRIHLHCSFHLTAPSPKALTLPSSCSTRRAHCLSSWCLLPLFHALTRAAPRLRSLPKHFHQPTPRMLLTLTLSRHSSPTPSDTQIFQTQIRCPRQSKLKFTSAVNNLTTSGRQAPNTDPFTTIILLCGQHTNSQFYTNS